MAYVNRACNTINPANSNGNIVALYPNDTALYIRDGLSNSRASTDGGVVTYSHSCAHASWGYNTRTYTINMDTALRNAINQKLSSGGLVNISNYVTNIPELQGKDLNGNRNMVVYGFINKSNSKSGTIQASQFGYWEGNWPINYPQAVTYSYDIPGVGHVSDTVTLITDGWYTESGKHQWVAYDHNLFNQYTKSQLETPPSQWHPYVNDAIPFYVSTMSFHDYGTNSLSYFVINGIYSWGTGSRGCYNGNACDVLLNADSNMFSGITVNKLNQYLNSGTERTFIGYLPTVMSNVIMAITNVDMVNNRITVKFAMRHDPRRSVSLFIPNHHYSVTVLNIDYSYPITSIVKPTDNWSIQFNEDSHFNPTVSNGNGPSTVIWDAQNNAVVLTAGNNVNNDNGYSKIISRNSGVLECSCSNLNGSIRVSIGGYSVTLPSNVSVINVRILSINNGQLGFWRVTPPGTGFSHAFNINYPATDNAPLVSFQNELYTAIGQALDSPGAPFLFAISCINDQFTVNVSGLVKCDVYTKDAKKYYAISVYDVNGDFTQLLVKNGMYVTLPITITVDIQVVNNSILVKAGMATIGFTSTSIGDVPSDADGVAVLLPAVAAVNKNGVRIGYAATTVNQNSFAFSFSALKEEVEQTDDFVSHYLQ